MNKNLFCSMQRKLIPSQQAVDQLKERLVQSAPAGRQPIPWKYGALAACAALLIAAYPIYHTLSPTLHPVLDGGQGGYGTYEIANEDAYGEIGTELPRLNIWDTQAPSQASAHSYAAGEGVNREVTQSDLETLLGGFIPQVLGWEGFDQLSGMLAFGPGHGDPLDTLFYGHFYADCDWGKLTLMVGGLGTKVSPDAIGRPEGYPGDALTVIEGIEVLAARFTNLDGTNYGEVSFTTRDGYSVFYAVNTPSPEQTEELLARLVQLAVLEDGLSPEALAPDPDAYAQGRGETDPMESKDAAAPPPLAGVSAWQSQPWFGGYYYDNDTGRYVIVQVEGQPLPDLDFGNAVFVPGKYSYTCLSGLMDQLNELVRTDPVCKAVMSGWWINEIDNRIDLTITEEDPHLLAILAQLDPEGDAIQVSLGGFAATDEDVSVSYQVLPSALPGSLRDGDPAGCPTSEEPIVIEPTEPQDGGEVSQPAREDLAQEPFCNQTASSYSGSIPSGARAANTGSYEPQA